MTGIARLFRRRQRPLVWEIKVTTPNGELVHLDTEQLYFIWKYGGRSLDGYLDLLGEYRLGWHVWVKPAGHEEDAAARVAALDGTGALPQSVRGALPYGMRRQR